MGEINQRSWWGVGKRIKSTQKNIYPCQCCQIEGSGLLGKTVGASWCRLLAKGHFHPCCLYVKGFTLAENWLWGLSGANSLVLSGVESSLTEEHLFFCPLCLQSLDFDPDPSRPALPLEVTTPLRKVCPVTRLSEDALVLLIQSPTELCKAL